MAYEFTEDIVIEFPNVQDQIPLVEEGVQPSHSLIVEISAIHAGTTANFNYYPEDALAESVQSWVSPYPKPIIMNHDVHSEPVGRVMAAKMDKEADGTPYVRLQIAVTDPEAVRKVMDQRYLTGSVGGKAEEAICNICGADWAKASMFNLPCKHQRGTPYKGKIAHMEMRKIGFKEYSFVNMPADERSSVRQLATNAAGEAVANDDGWVRAAQVFSIDMSKEEILELSESTSRNILKGMRKKDSSPLYHETRGAFLSAIAIAESEDDTKESNVANENLAEEEEDILAVSEDLSSDLATVATETAAKEAEEEVAEEAVEPVVAEGEEAEEAQEDASSDAGDAEGATDATESDEATDVVAEEETPEEDADATNSETELNERIQTLESRVEELETREQNLLGENAKLKTALKRTLAERVVDTKIDRGLHESTERDTLLEEHVKRSAASLADSLRDLARLPFKVREDSPGLPTVNELAGAVAGEENVVTENEPDKDESYGLSPEEQLENILVDTLMARRVL